MKSQNSSPVKIPTVLSYQTNNSTPNLMTNTTVNQINTEVRRVQYGGPRNKISIYAHGAHSRTRHV